MTGWRVLITNTTLATRTGTETYVRDLALALLRRGHAPVVYSPETGEIARELRKATVPVVETLSGMAVAPDLIHGNQAAELMTALLHFPGVPAVFFCHSWIGWSNVPPQHPRVLRCVAVDDTCRDRLALEHGVGAERLRVLLNAVDLERFRPRTTALPARPQRALVFSNTANDSTHLAAVREACARAGISLDVVGAEANNSTSEPESLLGQYDLVFAKARCALEAMASGAAVILCDMFGSGPLVTTDEFERLRRLNFGMRSLDRPINAEVLGREIARYDAADAAEVSRRVRASAGLDSLVEEIVELYGEVIAEYAQGGGTDALAESRAAAEFVRSMALAAKRECADFRAELLASSLTLRLRNQMPRFPLLERAVRSVARAARRRGL
ncbi:MAG TPA: glycosyltransferase, partial [Pyrinomonadaceae bacterium]|nr:glycosyltransferase [Pyrinomonadaceae bacterium]